jgi:hypothetical protein
MIWWKNLINGRLFQTSSTAFRSQIELLNERVKELETRDFLASRVKALTAELEQLKSREQLRNGVIETLHAKIEAVERCLPVKRKQKSGVWERFEKEITARSAAMAFAWFFMTLTFVGIIYYKQGDAHNTIDYLSYALPIAAAIFAGISVYREDWKARLFFGSLVLLFLGLDAFIAAHAAPEDTIFFANLAMEVPMLGGILYVGIKSAKRVYRADNASKKRVRLWHALVSFSQSLLLFLIAWALTSFFVGFYVHNYDCLHSHPADLLIACPKTAWPTLHEAFWPWPKFLQH